MSLFKRDYLARNFFSDCVFPRGRVNYEKLKNTYLKPEILKKLNIDPNKKNYDKYELVKIVMHHQKPISQSNPDFKELIKAAQELLESEKYFKTEEENK